jgi:hypothetical protein
MKIHFIGLNLAMLFLTGFAYGRCAGGHLGWLALDFHFSATAARIG